MLERLEAANQEADKRVNDVNQLNQQKTQQLNTQISKLESEIVALNQRIEQER